MVDSKENYKFDLEGKGLNSVIKIMSEKAGLLKIGQNHFDFTTCKLITIFVLIYALNNPWQLQSEELKWNLNLYPKWYKRNEFVDYDSDKKALQSTLAIWFEIMWISEEKFMFQIGAIIPIVLTKAFHSTD